MKTYTREELEKETCQSFGGNNCALHQCMFNCALAEAKKKLNLNLLIKMEILTAIVLVFCLFMSAKVITSTVLLFQNKIEHSPDWEAISTCLLWGAFYYLTKIRG